MKFLKCSLYLVFLLSSFYPNIANGRTLPAVSLEQKERKAVQDSLRHDLRDAKFYTNDKNKADYGKAREALKRAFANPYGKQNPEVTLQAANTEYQCFQSERNKPASGKKMDEGVIYSSTAAGFRYYCQTYEMLRHPKAGRPPISLSQKETQQMQNNAYDLFRCTQGFRATAGFYFNKKDWKSAYEYFKLAQEAIDCELLTHYASGNNAVQTDFATFRTEKIRQQLQYSCAVTAVQMRDHNLAIQELETAKYCGIETNRVRQQLCKEYKAIGDTLGYEKALMEGSAALPNEVWYSENLLNLYLNRHDHSKALGIIDRVIEHDPSNARNIELKGQLLDESGNVADAEVAFMQAIVYDTTLVVSYSSLGRIYFNRALETENALIEARQYDEVYEVAVPQYEAALPFYNRAYNNDKDRKDESIATAIRTILYKRFQSPKCKNAKQLIKRYNEVSKAYGLSTM